VVGVVIRDVVVVTGRVDRDLVGRRREAGAVVGAGAQTATPM
jgi:hypothetical protein